MSKVVVTGTNYNLFAYAVCPLCGRNRVVETYRKGRIRWDYFDMDKSFFIQIREQHARMIGGKSYGFTLISDDSLTLEEALKDPTYRKVAVDMIEQVKKIVKWLIAKGLIDPKELLNP